MKKITYLFIALFLMAGAQKANADEGMWLPMYIDRLNYVDMQKLGLQLTVEEIYSVNNASMKDAIIGLAESPNPQGFFCTGELVSSEGLMFTNHHCGFDVIQKHSSLENDYIKDGFWAMSREEELPNEGLTASILAYMADVTDSILPNINDTLMGKAKMDAIRKITSKIKKNASEDGKYNVVIKSFFEGNEYYMFVYEVFKDVRLVGAPPSSIGNFGGDTDNWMWPRHTGDFSIFRVYTAPDGSPAEYSTENVPMTPKHHLPVSLDGVKEGDYSMIWGFPGGTERYLTSSAISSKLDYFYPAIIEALGTKLDVWKEHMSNSQDVKIKYASIEAQYANGWKYFIGQDKGVKNLDVVGNKQAFEKEFTAWVNKDADRKEKYGSILTDIDEVLNARSSHIAPMYYARFGGVAGAGIVEFSGAFSGLQELMDEYKNEKDKDKKAKLEEQISKTTDGMKKYVAAHFKDYDQSTDQDVFTAVTRMYYEKVPADLHPELLDKMVSKYKNDFAAYSADVFEKSIFADSVKTLAFLDDPSLKVLDKDPAFLLMQGYDEKYAIVSKAARQGADKMNKAEKLYVKAVREMKPDGKFYPDANSTLRFSYGSVLDYYPADAVQFDYKTHLSGVMDKEDPTNDEFIVAEKLKELYETKDYGPYGTDCGRMPVCFLTNNDITGGNSGSPVVNAKGELIGLAFDGNWEAMSSDIAFAPGLQRTIVADVRYVLFIIDKFAGAGHLVDELTIRKTVPLPDRTEEIVPVILEETSVN